MVRNYQYIFEQKDDVTFNAVDYVVFGATLLISASIGLYYAIKDRKKTDEKEFLLAGRSMQTFPVALSLLSSFISAITLLGTPAEVYSNNTMYWWISIGFIISAAATAHIFVPVFYRLEITSVFQVRLGGFFYISSNFQKSLNNCTIRAPIPVYQYFDTMRNLLMYD